MFEKDSYYLHTLHNICIFKLYIHIFIFIFTLFTEYNIITKYNIAKNLCNHMYKSRIDLHFCSKMS